MNIKRKAWVWSGGVFLVFLFVWQQIQSVRLGYAVETTRKLIATQKTRNGYLGLELEKKISPAQLSLEARERLRMLPPTPDSLIVLESDPATDSQRSQRSWTLLSKVFFQ